jgi:hypothetical protein
MLEPVFCDLNQKISPLSVQKKYQHGVGSRNKSIDTALYPPLFWLDNIFKERERKERRKGGDRKRKGGDRRMQSEGDRKICSILHTC